MATKILVIEDDVSILTGIVDLLHSEGYETYSATNGQKGIQIYKDTSPDLVLLDIMIPEKSGYDVCREIRKKDERIPIIMLTAKDQEIDKVVGLEVGADDYVVKPFGVKELLARIRSVLRRSQINPMLKESDEPIVFGDVRIEPKLLKGFKKKKEFEISLREIQLLRLFTQYPDEAIDRATILEKIWGISYQGTTRTLDQHIVKLRQKIEDDPSQPKFIQTVHGIGYRFKK